MISIGGILYLIVAVFISVFVNVIWGWIFVVALTIFLFLFLKAIRERYSFDNLLKDEVYKLNNLSPESVYLLKRYSHYFVFPSSSREFSFISAVSQFSSIILIVIGMFQKFWWGIGIGIVNFFILNYIATSFTPTALVVNNPNLKKAQDESFDFVQDNFWLRK